MLYEHFKNGINLGGWLSQYEFIARQPLTDESKREHFDTFIKETDIIQIANWKFDHVRLPVSGYLLYDEEKDSLRKEVLDYIHKGLTWCTKCHLSVILDLHDVWGNVYGAMDKPMPLLTDRILQDRFLRIWQLLAQEFKGYQEGVLMFELLNEVSDASGAYPFTDVTGEKYDVSHKERFLWNQLYQNTIKIIREYDKDRWILVGSNGQNSVVYLKELQIVDDPYVFYNFHYYDPQVFTHQQAGFSEEMKEFDHVVDYPGDISDFVTYLNAHPNWKRKHALVAQEEKNDKALIERLLAFAEDFILQTGKELYCGEFGVIANAPAESAKNWLKDLTEIMEKNKIGHALWNYKYLDFGLLGLDGKPVSNILKK